MYNSRTNSILLEALAVTSRMLDTVYIRCNSAPIIPNQIAAVPELDEGTIHRVSTPCSIVKSRVSNVNVLLNQPRDVQLLDFLAEQVGHHLCTIGGRGWNHRLMMGKIGSSSETHRTIISFFDPWNTCHPPRPYTFHHFSICYTSKPVWRPTSTTFPNAWMPKVGDMTQESWTIDPGTRPIIKTSCETHTQRIMCCWNMSFKRKQHLSSNVMIRSTCYNILILAQNI
jgi:hypothetical protein